jgi:hypothetical protein
MSTATQRFTWRVKHGSPASGGRKNLCKSDPAVTHSTDKIGAGACQIRLSVHGRAANNLNAALL